MTEHTIKDYENVIITLIETDHNNKLYSEGELPDVINIIKDSVLQQYEVEECTITFSMMKYLHYSGKENSFYFNSKRTQHIHKEYHKKILKKIQPAIFVDTNNNNQTQIIETETIIDDNSTQTINDEQVVETQIEEKPKPTKKIVKKKIIKKIIKKKLDENPQVINVIDEPILNQVSNHPLEIYDGKTYNPNNLTHNPISASNNSYVFPIEKPSLIKKRTQYEFEPFGTQHIHDVQVDDPINDFTLRNSLQFDILRAVDLPPQKSDAWHAARHNAITASDMAQAIGDGKYEPQYMFILKKTTNVPFEGAAAMHHGTKHEDTASSIYAYRLNVDIANFGLMPHPKYPFLAASPDAICTKYKYDKIHNSQYVGMMVEIKCVVSRTIYTYHDVVAELGTTDIPYETLVKKIVPINYYEQMQMQLEVCELEHCHFWQCKITEYNSRQEFIDDTDTLEPFRSKKTKFEKGCIIQLLRKDKMQDILDGKYDDVVISSSKYIYPFKIEMSPYDCDIWVQEELSNLHNHPDPEMKDYFFDKVVYWKLEKAACFLVHRDKEWFKNNLPKMEKVWSYVTFLRNNEDILKIFCDFVNTRTIKYNKKIMALLDDLCNVNNPNYEENIEDIKKEINMKKERDAQIKKEKMAAYVETETSEYGFVDENPIQSSEYMFIDEEPIKPISRNIVKKTISKKKDNVIVNDPEYLFIDDEPIVKKPVMKTTINVTEKTKPIRKIRQVKSVVKKTTSTPNINFNTVSMPDDYGFVD